MTITLRGIFFVCAIICFGLCAAGVPARVNWDCLGKAFFTAAFLVAS